MDFFQIAVKERSDKQGGGLIAHPDFIVGRSKDLMVRAKNFYAIWDQEADEGRGLWSTDEYDVQRIVDAKLKEFAEKNKDVAVVKLMKSFGSNGQTTFRKFMSQISDNSKQLDNKIIFANTPAKKSDYASKRLPYALEPGECNAWNEMMGQLYAPEERAKIEWAFGAILSGDSKKIQKFLVLYGRPGAGKGTVIDVALMLFEGYTTTFVAKDLGSNNNQFAASAFAGNPLVGLQHDGDLSRIEDNTLINTIVSHETMKVNEKYKAMYDAKINAFLIMGTNKPVKISDAQSGLIRRLIDVHPTGNTFPPKKYHQLKDQLPFELGAIAHHCLEVYKGMGPNFYSDYRPIQMMFQTDVFLNFIETYFEIFEKQDGVSLRQAFQLYKEFCEETEIDSRQRLPMYKVRAELLNYFEKFDAKIEIDGVLVSSYYSKFKSNHYKAPTPDDPKTFKLVIEETTSLLDVELAERPAQYAKPNGTPSKYWDDSEKLMSDGEIRKPKPHQVVSTLLKDIDTTKEHYVKPPENLIVIDFDLTDEDGEKSLERNLAAASEWPPTYAEHSKSGKAVHLHYTYTGDTSQLARSYADGIEVKVFSGNSSLRRRLSKCNSVPIATISSGLPLKEKTRVLTPGKLGSEKALREAIARNLRKEHHPGTKPSVDFIKKILDDAYTDGLKFDVSDMYGDVIVFANNSTNKALECLKTVQSMRWKSEDDIPEEPAQSTDDRLVFFDVESYPNLFVICWKFQEKPGEKPSADNVTRMINPKPHEVEALLSLKLVGFNNRKYDNHMIWAAALGYSVIQLYHLSQKIISNAVGCIFNEAFNISWTDIYDYSSEKMGLKKWQIKLGLEHREMDIPWDEPVPEDRIMDVVDYCVHDVVSEEEVHNHRSGDYKARLILAELSGLTANDTTARNTAAIVFGREKYPQSKFVYTDLSKEFPGYEFKLGKSTYRGELVGEGGYVWGEPGLYRDVALLDIASMHPTSIGQLNLFGEYTPRFMALVEAQLAIKREDFNGVKELLGGKLRPYVEEIEALQRKDPAAAKKAAADLRHGLKIAINIVYGLTSAKFENPFRDIRNVDNIVAKRGALFMIDLKHFIQDELKLKVVHIKTDSVKVPGASAEDILQIQNFGAKYGYTFEHEATYAKFGLVNDAVYVAKKDECVAGEWVSVDESKDEKEYRRFVDDNGVPVKCWSATGSQYQDPYVFKTLFGHKDEIDYKDLCQTKHVQQGALYLDFGAHQMAHDRSAIHMQGDLGWVEQAAVAIKNAERMVRTAEKKPEVISPEDAQIAITECQAMYEEALKKLIFVGRTGQFTPVKEGYGGGQLYRIKDGKHYAVAGTKGYLWVDSSVGMNLPGDAIDYSYFDYLVDEARDNLAKFLGGSDFEDVDSFLS